MQAGASCCGGATLVALAKGLYWCQAGVTGLWICLSWFLYLEASFIMQAGASRPHTLAALAKGLSWCQAGILLALLKGLHTASWSIKLKYSSWQLYIKVWLRVGRVELILFSYSPPMQHSLPRLRASQAEHQFAFCLGLAITI